MTSVLKAVRAKYMGEDNSAAGDAGINSNTSLEDLRKQGIEQITIAQDQSKSQEERDVATKKAQELYDQYDKIKDKK